jgi:hypothetical protein
MSAMQQEMIVVSYICFSRLFNVLMTLTDIQYFIIVNNIL